MMKSKAFSMPELILLVGTRVALGVGIGLLLAGRLPRGARLGAGCALATVGALTTIPLALDVFGRKEKVEPMRNGMGRTPVAGRNGRAEMP
ncbi:MAG TPA: hypothetical protein VF765_11540 [Polyangiaceae bacterium]